MSSNLDRGSPSKVPNPGSDGVGKFADWEVYKCHVLMKHVWNECCCERRIVVSGGGSKEVNGTYPALRGGF